MKEWRNRNIATFEISLLSWADVEIDHESIVEVSNYQSSNERAKMCLYHQKSPKTTKKHENTILFIHLIKQGTHSNWKLWSFTFSFFLYVLSIYPKKYILSRICFLTPYFSSWFQIFKSELSAIFETKMLLKKVDEPIQKHLAILSLGERLFCRPVIYFHMLTKNTESVSRDKGGSFHVPEEKK